MIKLIRDRGRWLMTGLLFFVSTLLAGHAIKSFGYVPVFTALGFTHLTALAVLTAGLRAGHARDN